MADRAVLEPEPARERDTQLAELIVILAHDFKNALAALTANLHFLDSSLSESGDADSVEALSDSVTLCQVLDHFLRNLDLLGRYDSVIAHRSLTSLRALASDAVARFQRQAQASGLTFSVETPGGRDVLAFVDRDLFLRAAENLVANAIENAPKGSRVVIEIAGGDRESTLTVIDARQAPPPALLRPSAPPASSGQRPVEGYRGRGLGIFCADVAARAGGGKLERSGRPSECRLRLIAPAREQEAPPS